MLPFCKHMPNIIMPSITVLTHCTLLYWMKSLRIFPDFAFVHPQKQQSIPVLTLEQVWEQVQCNDSLCYPWFRPRWFQAFKWTLRDKFFSQHFLSNRSHFLHEEKRRILCLSRVTCLRFIPAEEWFRETVLSHRLSAVASIFGKGKLRLGLWNKWQL